MFAMFDTVVRCKQDHLFTTIWVPMASIKAVRLGSRRWQRCPVGKHWTTVTPVVTETLDRATLLAAQSVHDIHLP